MPYGVNSSISFIEIDKNIFAATDKGLFKTTDFGLFWEFVKIDSISKNIRTIFKFGRKILGKSGYNIVQSLDSGVTWEITGTVASEYLLEIDENLYAFNKQLIKSGDGGKNWDTISQAFLNFEAAISYPLIFSDNKLYVCSNFHGIFVSSDMGISWEQFGLKFTYGMNLLKTKNGFIVTTYESGILTTTEDGKLWTKSGYSRLKLGNIEFKGEEIFASTKDGLYNSVDSGKSWKLYGFNNCMVGDFIINDNKWFIPVYNRFIDDSNYSPNGINISEDSGKTWTVNRSGWFSLFVYSVIQKDNRLFAGATVGVHISDDFGKTWKETLPFVNYVEQILIVNNDIYACVFGGLYISKDNGNNWTAIKEFPTGLVSQSKIKNVGNYLFVKYGSLEYLHISNDLGETWNKIKDTFNIPIIENIDTNVIFDYIDNTVFLSLDKGQSWLDFNGDLQFPIEKVIIHGGYIIIENADGVYRKKLSELKPTSIAVNFPTDEDFLISPNPASDYIEINLDNVASPIASEKVQIFDILGIEVMSESIQPMTGSHRMNIEKLPAGVYFIRIGDRVEKFVNM
ncbi:MAG: T9SS type A sorting domain-containing protein [Candidatus Kapabacteria bacterium]|nr:T9SS type A sorting domain-containing protein [Candidatus Kapabacteria bacterium]